MLRRQVRGGMGSSRSQAWIDRSKAVVSSHFSRGKASGKWFLIRMRYGGWDARGIDVDGMRTAVVADDLPQCKPTAELPSILHFDLHHAWAQGKKLVPCKLYDDTACLELKGDRR